jgi:hypothetical protein
VVNDDAAQPRIRPEDELAKTTWPSATASTASEPFSSMASLRCSAMVRSASCWLRPCAVSMPIPTTTATIIDSETTRTGLGRGVVKARAR